MLVLFLNRVQFTATTLHALNSYTWGFSCYCHCSQSQQRPQPLTVDALAVVFVVDMPYKVVFLQQSVGWVFKAGEWLWCAAVAFCRWAECKPCHSENFNTPPNHRNFKPILNWANIWAECKPYHSENFNTPPDYNICFAKHSLEYSLNFTSFSN